MILAGGLSTRLYPLTRELPKPLVPVLDRPVVAHVMEYLRAHGVADLAINVHYYAQAVESFVGDGSAFDVRVTYLREAELMGSAGAVKQMESFFDSTFVVIGCDDVTDVDLQAAVDFHRRSEAEATIVLAHAVDVSQFGAVVVDDAGRIREFQEKPAPGTERSKLANTGIYIFEPSIFTRIPARTFYDFGQQVFPEMLAGGRRFFGMQQRAYWCDIGTPREYRRVHFDALGGAIPLRIDATALLQDGILIGSGVRVAPDARIVAPACIGKRSRIEADATIDSSIIWADVNVGAGARIRNSVVGRGVRVEPGSVIDGQQVAS